MLLLKLSTKLGFLSHLHKRPLFLSSSPSSRHHVHLDVLLLLARRHSSHLSYQSGVPDTDSSSVSEKFRIVLFLVQSQIAGGLKSVQFWLEHGQRKYCNIWRWHNFKIKYLFYQYRWTAPGSPMATGLRVLTLAALYQRCLVDSGCSQGCAGSWYGWQGSHPSSIHRKSSSVLRSWLLKVWVSKLYREPTSVWFSIYTHFKMLEFAFLVNNNFYSFACELCGWHGFLYE